jgi:hypothetical protein
VSSRSRRFAVLMCALTTALGVALPPNPMMAAGACKASFVILGPAPTLTGMTPTDWFNVFGDDFDPTVPATLTFGVPVIPWSIDQPKVVQPAVTAYVMPAKYMASGFKWTFRARDSGIKTIDVQIAGSGCQATTLVDFSPPATSTADLAAPKEPSSLAALLLLLSFAGGLLAFWRRLDRPALDRPGRPGS